MGYTNSEDSLPFNWATPPQQHQVSQDALGDVGTQDQETVTDTSVHDVVSTIKQIVNTFVDNQTESSMFTSSTPTTTSTTEVTFQETFNSNNTMMEATVNEFFGSNSTVMDLNTTLINEIADSNATVTVATAVGETANATNFISDTLSTVVDKVITTTETVINTVSEAVTPSGTSDLKTDGLSYENHGDNIEEKTLYIVLGVILGALILIIIILLIIYKRYKSKSDARSGVYCVTDFNEVNTPSCRNFDQRTADLA